MFPAAAAERHRLFPALIDPFLANSNVNSNWRIGSLLDDVDGDQRLGFKGLATASYDLSEKDGRYDIKFDMPGFEKEDIKVEVKEKQLILSAERKMDKDENKDGIRRRERFFGTVRRSIQLPDQACVENIKANHENGVLTIQVPKLDKVEYDSKRISIQ